MRALFKLECALRTAGMGWRARGRRTIRFLIVAGVSDPAPLRTVRNRVFSGALDRFGDVGLVKLTHTPTDAR